MTLQNYLKNMTGLKRNNCQVGSFFYSNKKYCTMALLLKVNYLRSYLDQKNIDVSIVKYTMLFD